MILYPSQVERSVNHFGMHRRPNSQGIRFDSSQVCDFVDHLLLKSPLPSTPFRIHLNRCQLSAYVLWVNVYPKPVDGLRRLAERQFVLYAARIFDNHPFIVGVFANELQVTTYGCPVGFRLELKSNPSMMNI
jgi:hypothetical protein